MTAGIVPPPQGGSSVNRVVRPLRPLRCSPPAASESVVSPFYFKATSLPPTKCGIGDALYAPFQEMQPPALTLFGMMLICLVSSSDFGIGVVVNKSEIVRALASESELSNSQVEKLVSRFLEIITLSMSCDEDVLLTGFGRFEARHKNAVLRCNPRTREPVEVPAKTTVRFVPSPLLKRTLNEG